MGERRIIWLVRRWLIDDFWKQCCALISHLIFTSWVMNCWHEFGAMDSLYTMRLSELGIFAMFCGLKNHSITETDILWYDLRDYLCWFWCNARIFSPSVPWPSLTSIMNYPLCMTHDLATAYHYDHAWTAKWAQNICTLSMLMSPMRLRNDNRQHGRRGHLYETKGAWKKYPSCFALLDVGFMIVLRRTDRCVLIWACSAVLTNQQLSSFRTLQL